MKQDNFSLIKHSPHVSVLSHPHGHDFFLFEVAVAAAVGVN